LNDKEIMFAVRDGDIGRLSLLFEKYRVPLYNYFTRLTFDRQASEDLVQDVFMKIIKYRRTYRGEGTFSTWLFQVAHNTFYDYVRKKKDHSPIDEHEYQLPDDTDIDQDIMNREDAQIVRKALGRLPDEDREVLVLRSYRKMKYSEIAAMMDCPVGTIKARVHFAVKKLKSNYHQLLKEA